MADPERTERDLAGQEAMVLDKAGGLVRVLHRWQLTGVNDHPEAVRAVASHLENLARDLGVLVDMKEQL